MFVIRSFHSSTVWLIGVWYWEVARILCQKMTIFSFIICRLILSTMSIMSSLSYHLKIFCWSNRAQNKILTVQYIITLFDCWSIQQQHNYRDRLSVYLISVVTFRINDGFFHSKWKLVLWIFISVMNEYNK